MHFLEAESLNPGPSAPEPDLFAFKHRLHTLLSGYGQVLRLHVVRADQGADRRVMCFLRMGTPEQEQAVVDALGMGRFGGDLVMVVAWPGGPFVPPAAGADPAACARPPLGP